ncbi:hypothetical protein AAA799E16_00621 [Marine Group I thaumarchaeote SCGC AAA799-E16]|uniref:Uncharacterized protein n=4 Tax=Marine Group I TaxID=905826 RepID=A0A081RPE5_9ARCH|nr:hypothetical protein AAA799N04_00466 [Marine Group I thaumarchaeote SCGC AAA799-N04]KER06562.1 hypothetical protein AAA799E16_00621 [Marine Group I thaumarchaeote SCGC AAA799-E16]KFM16124.1 hypothetical protein AAA799D11_00923 [Marine Group I thaumarchaeote SCGC AAA799-D11]KFM17861.1 hypothetical protein SCCGRSA3_01801 [Marine Group I thaumarchaeote SCGC RSA3]
MDHVLYFEGDSEKISWKIETGGSIAEQNREHVQKYKNKVTNLQSKYIALHVGLFWAIGVFIIKNEDCINVKCDEKAMFEHFKFNKEINDEFIKNRMRFIKQLISQRKLKMEFELIES